MLKRIRSLPAEILAWAFDLLYHQFAWSYDAVAWLVSSGHWRAWTLTALDLLDPIEYGPVLELGFGRGHLQLEMAKRGFFCVGVDESRQMSHLTRQNFKKSQGVDRYYRLVRGRAENLPIADGTAAVILATFPAEYIFQAATIESWRRVLIPNGKVIILMGVEPGSFSIINFLMRLIYRLTNATFKNILGPQDYLDRIRDSGFEIEPLSLTHKKDRLWYIYGHKI